MANTILTGATVVDRPEPVYQPGDPILYPRVMYRPLDTGYEDCVVASPEAEAVALGEGWYNSPADWGLITAPNTAQQKAIAIAKAMASQAVPPAPLSTLLRAGSSHKEP